MTMIEGHNKDFKNHLNYLIRECGNGLAHHELMNERANHVKIIDRIVEMETDDYSWDCDDGDYYDY
jgi:hypothetical protein